MSKSKIYVIGAGTMEQQDKLKELLKIDCISDVIMIDEEKAKEMGVPDKLGQSCINSAKAMEDLNKAFAKMKVPSKKKGGSKYHS